MGPRKRLVISAASYETRAALLEDGLVAELFFERKDSTGVAGNVYKGRVRKILPGMQSAFVDIGLEKDAFLYVSDVVETSSGDEEEVSGDEPDEVAVKPRTTGPAIETLLHEGQDLLVQVAKEPIAGKGARVTTHVSLPGRYLVFMPTTRHLGVSRRIEDEDERIRVKELLPALRDRAGGGFIVRTAGAGRSEAELANDADYLVKTWEGILDAAKDLEPPRLARAELGLIEKLLRDVMSGDVEELIVDNLEEHRRCLSLLSRLEPELADRVSLYNGTEPLFDVYGIEGEIERALRSKVWLKSGGYIVINQTEALVAIDVNTGRYVGRVGLEDTVLRTNLEAAGEIVRQIRLRDLGGIIVLDFIDMEEPENRARLVDALEEELRHDRSKTRILQISDFGLIEMTRKRVKGSLEGLLCAPCAWCGGSGRVKSVATICGEIHRELRRARRGLPEGRVWLRVHPEVAEALNGPERVVFDAMQRDLARAIDVIVDTHRRRDQFEVDFG